MPLSDNRRYWHRTAVLSLTLLTLWLVLTLVVVLWTPYLDFSFLGWPFGFWAASQGALVLFCVIVWAYALLMDRLDQDHGGGDVD